MAVADYVYPCPGNSDDEDILGQEGGYSHYDKNIILPGQHVPQPQVVQVVNGFIEEEELEGDELEGEE